MAAWRGKRTLGRAPQVSAPPITELCGVPVAPAWFIQNSRHHRVRSIFKGLAKGLEHASNRSTDLPHQQPPLVSEDGNSQYTLNLFGCYNR
uniref:LysR_substrate domain-containing protein n=1 Tax=Bursaphelenchus xylophilus TaxID=6326 RepID=A0A1I7RN41_BURXY